LTRGACGTALSRPRWSRAWAGDGGAASLKSLSMLGSSTSNNAWTFTKSYLGFRRGRRWLSTATTS
jgi:hypothetical protein